MFRDKKDKGSEPSKRAALDTVIGPGAELTGDVTVRAGTRIDGRVKGNVSCQGELIIGKDGAVEGEVKAASAVLAGRITGKLSVEGKAELSSTARMEGDVVCAKLVIEEGAFFQGHCQMSTSAVQKPTE
jgi:cytoskeletal protein CcmA (bactofilin family)